MDEADKQIMMQDWLRLVEFGDKCIEFTGEKDHVIDEIDIGGRPAGSTKLSEAKRLSDLSDFRFFSLGPVYMCCSVPFDILGEFRTMLEDTKKRYEGPRIVLNFKNPVFAGLGPWNAVLEGVWLDEKEKAGFDQLVKFMTSQRIRQKETQTYWTVNCVELVIPDPMAVDRNEYDPEDSNKKAIIALFLPSGNRYQVATEPIGKYPPVRLRRATPAPQVVQEATVVDSVSLKDK